MRASVEVAPRVRLLEAVLEGLVRANQELIRAGIVPASPLDAEVVYRREPSGLEDWQLADKVARAGYGDCEDLNGWECAGRREHGDPDARLVLKRTGRRTYHAIVQLGDGSLVDVCPELGMGRRRVNNVGADEALPEDLRRENAEQRAAFARSAAPRFQLPSTRPTGGGGALPPPDPKAAGPEPPSGLVILLLIILASRR